jgi:hypothetical protein
MEKKIKKVKIEDDTLVLSYSYRDDTNEPVVVEGEKHKARFHDDLRQAFKNLSIHLAIMTGYINPAQVKNIETPKAELSEDFRVTGFSYGKDEDDPGVTITGGRNLPNMNNKFIALNAPYVRYGEADESAYKFVKDLEQKVQRCEVEVALYLSGEKRGEDPQGKLFGENGQPKDGEDNEDREAA